MTQYSVNEYELATDTLWDVYTADVGERCVGGNYVDGDIEAAIVPHRKENEADNLSKCTRYSRRTYKDTVYYKPLGYYLLPELDGDLYRGFVFQSYDLGIEGTADENGIQDFWVTRGFFYPPDRGTLDIDLPILRYHVGRQAESRKIEPFQMTYFKHTHALRHRYRLHDNGFCVSYSYLDEDTGQAVFMENMQNLFYCDNYRNTSYKEIWAEYKKGKGSYNGNAYWSFIIPWSRNRLICCYENFQLAVLDADTGDEHILIDYAPGIAVWGCDFRGAFLEGELADVLYRNGGIL